MKNVLLADGVTNRHTRLNLRTLPELLWILLFYNLCCNSPEQCDKYIFHRNLMIFIYFHSLKQNWSSICGDCANILESELKKNEITHHSIICWWPTKFLKIATILAQGGSCQFLGQFSRLSSSKALGHDEHSRFYRIQKFWRRKKL